jgi:hypothetical protein
MTDLRDAADFRRKQLRESFACRSCGSPDPAIIRGDRCSDCTCWLVSHIEGCPGKSGGEHQLRPEWITIGDPDDGYVVEVEIAE